ncbi:MAG: hypothetical protein ACYSOT_03960, partial [Planctomycetota bacterium]
ESLDVVKASSLHSTLAVGGAATLEESLDVVKASSLHSTLAVGGATTLEESLDVVKASSLHSTLAVGGAATLESTLYVGELVEFNKDLVIQGNLTVNGTQTIIDTTILAIEDNKIELNTDGDLQAFGIYANVASHGGEISLYYEVSQSRWEFNRDLYVLGNLSITENVNVDTINTSRINFPSGNYIDDVSGIRFLYVQETSAFEGDSSFNSNVNIIGNLTLYDALSVQGDSSFNSNVDVFGGLSVEGDSSFNSNVDVFGALYVNETSTFEGDSSFNSNVNITGNLTLNDRLDVFGALYVEETSTFDGDSSFNSNVNIGGNLTLHDTLRVFGATTLESSLEVVSNITTPIYIIKDNISSNTITLVAPNLTATSSYTLTLPPNDGEDKQFLQTDGDGTLSWVTPDNSQQLFGNIITSGDYTTSNITEKYLTPFDISYTTTLADSSVFIQYKVPYEASIQADQRISFIIKKSVNQGPETTVQTDGNLGPRNATGGMRNIYISNLFETNTGSIGDNIVYKLYSQLESNVTALDPLTEYATVRKAGVSFDTSGNYGSYMFKEFSN